MSTKKLAFIVGPMSSGCRLIRNIVNSSPNIICWLDTSHGTKSPPVENNLIIRKEAVPIVIQRDIHPTIASQKHHWTGKPEYVLYENSVEGIQEKYSGALVVIYEELCNDHNREIVRIADYLGVSPWQYKGPEPVNQNGKWDKE